MFFSLTSPTTSPTRSIGRSAVSWQKRVHDVRIRALANECSIISGPSVTGVGSQISQTAALMLPNKLDHFIKEKLGIKGYARYMDDGYLIHPSKEYLKECLTRMKEVCDSLGIILNTKKTKIKKLSDGFKFLQIRFKLTETGKVLRKMSFESIKKIRRKLKKFKLWNIEAESVKNCPASSSGVYFRSRIFAAPMRAGADT